MLLLRASAKLEFGALIAKVSVSVRVVGFIVSLIMTCATALTHPLSTELEVVVHMHLSLVRKANKVLPDRTSAGKTCVKCQKEGYVD